MHLPKSLWQEETYFCAQPGGILATVPGYADELSCYFLYLYLLFII